MVGRLPTRDRRDAGVRAERVVDPQGHRCGVVGGDEQLIDASRSGDQPLGGGQVEHRNSGASGKADVHHSCDGPRLVRIRTQRSHQVHRVAGADPEAFGGSGVHRHLIGAAGEFGHQVRSAFG